MTSTTRRAALALPAALAWPVAANAQRKLDLSNRADYLTAIQKMRGALDERLCMGGITGIYYAVMEEKLIPLYGVNAGTFSRYKKMPDGTFEGRTFEVAYFTDWNTGQLLETYKNPITGETVDVPQTRMGPSKVTVTADGLKIGEGRGLSVNHRFLPARVVNNDVWIVEESLVSMPDGAPGPRFRYNEVTTYHATLDDLNNPALNQTPTLVHFSVVVTWRPWLKMGDRPGHLMGNGTGRRYAKMTDYPALYQELTKKHHPDVWADPGAILDKI